MSWWGADEQIGQGKRRCEGEMEVTMQKNVVAIGFVSE